MANYRIKPAVVQAIPVSEVLNGYQTDPKKLPQWVQDAYEKGELGVLTYSELKVKGKTGTAQDMLVNNAGDLSVVWKNDFEHSYEPV